jgi:hypothetical protein
MEDGSVTEVVTGAVKKVYKAFGGGTNDWVLLGP